MKGAAKDGKVIVMMSEFEFRMLWHKLNCGDDVPFDEYSGRNRCGYTHDVGYALWQEFDNVKTSLGIDR